MPLHSNRHSVADLSAFMESLALHRREQVSSIDSDIANAIDNFPSIYKLAEMGDAELDLLQETISFCWKRVTGERLPRADDMTKTSNNIFLDGPYWLLPGGVMVSGINHYSIAKKNKGLFCSLLNLNPLVFEQWLHADPNKVVERLILNGAVRTVVDRENNKVFCQTTEESWPWVREKLSKMYHKIKIAKILDPTKPFKGWESGVPVRILK